MMSLLCCLACIVLSILFPVSICAVHLGCPLYDRINTASLRDEGVNFFLNRGKKKNPPKRGFLDYKKSLYDMLGLYLLNSG